MIIRIRYLKLSFHTKLRQTCAFSLHWHTSPPFKQGPVLQNINHLFRLQSIAEICQNCRKQYQEKSIENLHREQRISVLPRTMKHHQNLNRAQTNKSLVVKIRMCRNQNLCTSLWHIVTSWSLAVQNNLFQHKSCLILK